MMKNNETSTDLWQDYETSILNTLLGGLGIGIIGLVGYPLFITKGPQFIAELVPARLPCLLTRSRAGTNSAIK